MLLPICTRTQFPHTILPEESNFKSPIASEPCGNLFYDKIQHLRFYYQGSAILLQVVIDIPRLQLGRKDMEDAMIPLPTE